MIGVRLARVAVPLVAAVLITSCIFGPDTSKPSPSPSESPTASPGPTRPRLELSTYQYALQTKGKMRVGVRDNAAPMSARASGGRYDGFEPDIAREIARAIWGPNEDPDAHIEWVSVDESTRVSALTSSQADITIAALVIDDDARKVIDLTDTYLRTGQRLLVKKSNEQIKEVVDVTTGDQTVCAIKGSQAELELGRVTNDRAKVLPLDTLDFCVQALQSGAADAFTHDELVLAGIVAKDPSVKIVGKPFTEKLLGIGIKKNVSADRQGFREFVNTALLTIVANRTWAVIFEKDLTPVTGDRKQRPTD